MKNLKYVLSLLLVLVFAFVLVGCKDKGGDKEVDWNSKTVSMIEPVQETFDASYEYDEFTLDMLKIKVSYTDGTSREIPVEESMLDEKSLKKTKAAGNPKITIEYIDNAGTYFNFTANIHLVDSALLDKNLNDKLEYDLVVKAIRNLEVNRINFIVEENVGVQALMFKYTFDQSIMQLSDFKAADGLNGVIEGEIKDGALIVTILLDEPVTAETTLFSVAFAGNFRTSKLAIDNTFANTCYALDENLQTVKLSKVLYHASIK